MNKSIADIDGVLLGALHMLFDVNGDINFDDPLTGENIRLSGLDLVYFFLEIEHCFGTTLPVSSLTNYNLFSLNDFKKQIITNL